MSAVDELILEEAERLKRIRAAKLRDFDMLPKGSIRKKRINGREYHYLQWRDGKHIRCKYIPADELEAVSNCIDRRNNLKNEIAAINADLSKLQRIIKASAFAVCINQPTCR